jgi:catechol 2,3-dioxygenase-like lactoylglutathione lyase family enzyme
MRVAVVRYTSDVARLAGFYEALGASRRTESRTGGFVDLVAGRGIVMVHAAADSQNRVPAGGAELSFEVDDLDEAQRTLADLQPVRWDESYGEHLAIRDPRGDGIWIDAAMTDFYGYELHDPRPNDLELLATRFSNDLRRDAAFFASLGFAVRAGSSEHWTSLASSGGVIGLHPATGPLPAGPRSPDNPAAPPALVTISFETHEPLPQLHDRLLNRGIACALDADGPAPHVTVTDPDGVEIEIHVAP